MAIIEIDLKKNFMLPRWVLVEADSLITFLKNRKIIFSKVKPDDKFIIGLFFLARYIYAKVYLSMLTVYLLFCVRVLHLSDEEIYPPYRDGKL